MGRMKILTYAMDEKKLGMLRVLCLACNRLYYVHHGSPELLVLPIRKEETYGNLCV